MGLMDTVNTSYMHLKRTAESFIKWKGPMILQQNCQIQAGRCQVYRKDSTLVTNSTSEDSWRFTDKTDSLPIYQGIPCVHHCTLSFFSAFAAFKTISLMRTKKQDKGNSAFYPTFCILISRMNCSLPVNLVFIFYLQMDSCNL